MKSDPLLLLHPDDDVAVARRDLYPDETVLLKQGSLSLRDRIRMSHKFSLRTIPTDAPVRKYGHVIGFATRDILPGTLVHDHNLEIRPFRRKRVEIEELIAHTGTAPHPQPTFHGYLRRNGQVGTRNYLALISSVNCSAGVSRQVESYFNTPEFRERWPQVDGIIALTHSSGCCQQPGENSERLERVLLGMARHPNVFGCLVIGLGCEGMQVPGLKEKLRAAPGHAETDFLVIQQTGGVRKTAAAAIEALESMLPRANAVERSEQPASKLILGMQCGGSDANSGITANPAVGAAADILVRHGGSAVLAETPEIYGAEHLLTARAVSPEVAEALMKHVRWWEAHAKLHGATINNNPTPGNKQGGLSTIYEKSLGAVAKAGQSPLAAVYDYAAPIDTPGLGFMDSPGYDPVSMTGLCAGGATIGVFTTGRGSCYGCKPMPVLKIASHTPLYQFMSEDMDVNAGRILDGTMDVAGMGDEIFNQLLALASGVPSKSEAQGLGDETFAPWITGPVF